MSKSGRDRARESERERARERESERETERGGGVKFIHLKPILLKLISGLYGLNRLMTSTLKAGKKVSFILK